MQNFSFFSSFFLSFLVKLINIFFYCTVFLVRVRNFFSILRCSKVHPYLFFITYFGFGFMFKALIDLGFILVYVVKSGTNFIFFPKLSNCANYSYLFKKLYLWDFPGGTVVKNPPTNAGDTGSSPGPGRSHMLWSN